MLMWQRPAFISPPGRRNRGFRNRWMIHRWASRACWSSGRAHPAGGKKPPRAEVRYVARPPLAMARRRVRVLPHRFLANPINPN